MAASLINLQAAGALLQGQRFVTLDFGNGTVDLAIVKSGTSLVLFKKYTSSVNGSDSTYVRASYNYVAQSGWDNEPAIKPIFASLLAYALPDAQAQGVAYATDSTQIGVYTDGKSVLSSGPITQPTLSDVIKQTLGTTGNMVTGAAGDKPMEMTVPFYKKPLVWIAAVVVAGIAYFAFKK